MREASVSSSNSGKREHFPKIFITLKWPCIVPQRGFFFFFNVYINFNQLPQPVKSIKLQMEREQAHWMVGWVVIYISEAVKCSEPKWKCHPCPLLGFYQVWVSPVWKQTEIWICKASPDSSGFTTWDPDEEWWGSVEDHRVVRPVVALAWTVN